VNRESSEIGEKDTKISWPLFGRMLIHRTPFVDSRLE
jgi:hypothetical protein